ncbi:DivIVA domain-containing protein [Longispora sp. NPDC051575]|uniref:DivIVA domain-containing protein n=1 Tax=Longispora sp. NPDC051575 TaxID=3154943 RepID=UPI003441FAEB
MPLTPADVHNVAFKKPPIGKRGYDEDEVDAFLDEVERELARLIEENTDIRAASAAGGRQAPAGGGNDPRLVAELTDLKAQFERVQREKAAAEQAARQMQQELEQINAGGGAAGGDAGEQQALRVLMMAQRTADDHVADARREADKVLAEARAKADEVTRDARGKAEALERDARQRHQEAMGGLETKRNALQKHLEELKAFEREYRTRLKAYLESQLRDLSGKGQGLEDELTRAESGRSNGTPAGGLATAGLGGGGYGPAGRNSLDGPGR